MFFNIYLIIFVIKPSDSKFFMYAMQWWNRYRRSQMGISKLIQGITYDNKERKLEKVINVHVLQSNSSN